MTIPRELRLREHAEGIRLVQVPAVELEALRLRHVHRAAGVLTPAAGLLERDVSEAIEIWAVFRPESAVECGLRVHSAEGEYTSIGYDARAAQLFVDRTRSGHTDFNAAFPGRHGGPLHPAQGLVAIRIFLDCTSVEVFGNDGECVVTSLIFPTAERAALEFYALGGEAQLEVLDVFHLGSR